MSHPAKTLTIGNITNDIIINRNGKRREGCGGTIYASLTATRLEYDSHLLTRFGGEALLRLSYVLEDYLLEEEKLHWHLHWIPDWNTTTFLNDYSSGVRKQSLLRRAGRISYTPVDCKDFPKNFEIILLNPMYHEITPKIAELARKDSKILALDVQGLVRRCNSKTREITIENWKDRENYLKHIDILKVSSEEIKAVSQLGNYRSVCEELYSLGTDIIALTFGSGGSLIYDGKKGEFHSIHTFNANVLDPTGAGDVFDMSFAIRYYETGRTLEAGLFASAAASLAVEGVGLNSILSRKEVEERYEILKNEEKA